jgi:hypothetical protein
LRAKTLRGAIVAADREAEADRALDRAAVQHRQRAGQREVDRRGLRVGRAPNASSAPRRSSTRS